MQRAKRCNELVLWVSQLLKMPTLATFDELKNGVALLQVVHSLDPFSFDLSRVDFCASTPYHFEKNLKLLQEVMAKIKMDRPFIIEQVMQGEKRNDLYYLVCWMKDFVTKRRGQAQANTDHPYDPITERNRAKERRTASLKPFRVATLPNKGGGTLTSTALAGFTGLRRGHSVSDIHEVASAASDNSHAWTTALGAGNSKFTTMRMRSAQLESWARSVFPPASTIAQSGIGSSVLGAESSTPRPHDGRPPRHTKPKPTLPEIAIHGLKTTPGLENFQGEKMSTLSSPAAGPHLQLHYSPGGRRSIDDTTSDVNTYTDPSTVADPHRSLRDACDIDFLEGLSKVNFADMTSWPSDCLLGTDENVDASAPAYSNHGSPIAGERNIQEVTTPIKIAAPGGFFFERNSSCAQISPPSPSHATVGQAAMAWAVFDEILAQCDAVIA